MAREQISKIIPICRSDRDDPANRKQQGMSPDGFLVGQTSSGLGATRLLICFGL